MFAISIQYMPKALFNLCARSLFRVMSFFCVLLGFVFVFGRGYGCCCRCPVLDRFRNAHAITLIAFDWSNGRFLYCRNAKIETDACTNERRDVKMKNVFNVLKVALEIRM